MEGKSQNVLEEENDENQRPKNYLNKGSSWSFDGDEGKCRKLFIHVYGQGKWSVTYK